MHLSILLLPTVVATLVSAEHHGSKKIHAIVGANKREETGLSVFKRGDDAQFTFYKVSIFKSRVVGCHLPSTVTTRTALVPVGKAMIHLIL
jgi:hypothetical protein